MSASLQTLKPRAPSSYKYFVHKEHAEWKMKDFSKKLSNIEKDWIKIVSDKILLCDSVIVSWM